LVEKRYKMQHLDGSGTPVLYIGRTVLKGQYCAVCFSLDDSVLLCIVLFCSWVRTRKHVEWYPYGRCGHCFSSARNNQQNRHWIKQWYKRKPQHTHTHTHTTHTHTYTHNTHTYTHTRARAHAHNTQHTHTHLVTNVMSKPNDYRILIIWWDTQSCYPTVVKQILTCEKQSLKVCVHPLRYAIWTVEKTLYTWNS
jgi:hypothetical protein